jgi:integrase/recombinase XerD
MVGSSVGRVADSGPLGLCVEGFRGWLLERGYAGETVARHVRLLGALSRCLEGEGLDSSGLTTVVLMRFRAAHRGRGDGGVYRGGLDPIVGYLRDVGVMPLAALSVTAEPVEVLLERYRGYLVFERCLAEDTITSYLKQVRPFLERRVAAGQLDLEHLTPGEISAFIQDECSHHPHQSVKVTVTALRSLLRFLHLDGVLDECLTGAVPSVAFWRLAGLPRSLESDVVDRLLASCDRGTPAGRRDFAILLLLVRLGLRRTAGKAWGRWSSSSGPKNAALLTGPPRSRQSSGSASRVWPPGSRPPACPHGSRARPPDRPRRRRCTRP